MQLHISLIKDQCSCTQSHSQHILHHHHVTLHHHHVLSLNIQGMLLASLPSEQDGSICLARCSITHMTCTVWLFLLLDDYTCIQHQCLALSTKHPWSAKESSLWGAACFTMININGYQFVVASQWSSSRDINLWWLHNDQHQQISICGGFTMININRCQFVVASQWSTVVASQWSTSMNINHNDQHQGISICGGFTKTNINRYQLVVTSQWLTSTDINLWQLHNDQHQQISMCGGFTMINVSR